MRHFKTFALGLALAMPMAAHAAPTLLAIGTLDPATLGNADLSGKSYMLEDGINAQNVLGGTGSGFAYAGGTTFLALPDRGPNATTYDANVDNTTSYISRFSTMNMVLTANAPGSALAFSLNPEMTSTTLLYSTDALIYGSGVGLGATPGTNLPAGDWINTDIGKYYFSGRSDNFSASSALGSVDPNNARFDPESIRVSNDGKSVFISDEYGPYIRQFDRATGALIKTFDVPANLVAAVQKPIEKTATGEIASNTAGRTTNKGMEGLALTPDGKTLVGIMQAPLIQDATAQPNLLRIVTIDIATGAQKEFAYMLTGGTGVSDIVALNDHQFLVDERDGKGLGDGSSAKIKKMYLIDTAGAVDVQNLDANAAAAKAVSKVTSPFVDLVTMLGAAGISAANVPAKIEGLALGYDVNVNGVLTHTLWVTNDNDYLPNVAGQNKFYVIGFTDADLPSGYAVPEPATWAMMIGGFALVGAGMRRRKLAVHFA